MLSLARLLHRYRDRQREREWTEPTYERPFTISDERLCVVGLETVGSGIAKRAAALGMDVVGVRQSDGSVSAVSTIYDPAALHEAVADTRFVALAAPLTSATEGMIDADVLDAMRTNGYLIKRARHWCLRLGTAPAVVAAVGLRRGDRDATRLGRDESVSPRYRRPRA